MLTSSLDDARDADDRVPGVREGLFRPRAAMSTVRLSASAADNSRGICRTGAWAARTCSSGDSAAAPTRRFLIPRDASSPTTIAHCAEKRQIGVADECWPSRPYRHSVGSWRLLSLRERTKITERTQLFANASPRLLTDEDATYFRIHIQRQFSGCCGPKGSR